MCVHSYDFLRTRKFIFSCRKKIFLYTRKVICARTPSKLCAEGGKFACGRKFIFVRKKNNFRAHTNIIESGRIINRLITENYKIHKNDENSPFPFLKSRWKRVKFRSDREGGIYPDSSGSSPSRRNFVGTFVARKR